MIHDYIGVSAAFFFSAVFAILMIFLSSVLGPKKKTPGKDIPYEAGKDPFALPGGMRISVHFYVIAMIFIIFDVELAFLFPWAVLFRELGWMGLAEITLFVFFVLLAFLYAWRNGVLNAKG